MKKFLTCFEVKHFLLLLIGLFCVVIQVSAQTYNGSTFNTAGNGLIPSTGTGGCGVDPQTATIGGTRFNCAVAGVSAGSILTRVKINLNHTADGDLDIFLVSPAGAVIELSTDNGGTGDNFNNTVFIDAAPDNIATQFSSAPYSCNFRPEGTLTSNSCGITVNPTVTTLAGMGATAGTWQLLILDDNSGDAGAMLNWSLEFKVPSIKAYNGNTTNTAGNGLIPSVGTGACGVEPQTAATGGTRFNCAVSGVPPGAILTRVNLNLNHAADGDLDIFLVSPSGAVLELSTDNGGSDDNFTNTVFSDAASSSITTATAPYTGSFRPEGTLTSSSCGINVNPTVTTLAGMGTTAGTWQLLILDDNTNEAGTMLSWSLEFELPKSSTFNGSTTNTAGNGLIPSVGTGACGVEPQTAATGGTRFNCAVAGVASGAVLKRVNISLSHTAVGDLRMYLVSPAGAVLELSTGNGGSDDNFTNTVFSDAASLSITTGTAPFTGNFRPEGTLTSSSCGINVNPTVTTLAGMGTTAGTWQLLILDDKSGDAGTMLSWSLTFERPEEPPLKEEFASASKDTTICEKGTATLSAFGGGTYVWSTSATTQSITVSQPGRYVVTVTSPQGCVGQADVVVTVRPKAKVSCLACMNNVNVSLDQNCRFWVSPDLVMDGFKNCPDGALLKEALQVLIRDGNNDSYVDCAGTYDYVVTLKKGYEDCFEFTPCWGKITAEDKTAPILVCAPKDITLDCYDVNYVLNNRLTIGNVGATSSPRPAATGSQTINNAEGVAGSGDACNIGLIPPGLVSDNIKNLGYAYFKDNCYDCGCRITLKWTDKVVFYSCDDMKTNGGIYATISREWVATDCNGMSSSYVQKINFTRPDLDDFVFNGPGEGKYDRVVEYNSCTPDKSLIKKEDVTPYVCSYFNTSANPRCLFIDQVECNYSVSIKDTEFPICGGKGVKIDRELYVFDWCAGGIVDTFHVLIKIGDFEAPKCEYAHGAPFDISTGPMDCTAAIPVTVAGIKSAFGVTIKDNCSLGNISVSVYTKDRYVKGILVYEGPEDPICKTKGGVRSGELRDDERGYQLGECDKDNICWDKVDYAVMNGMMIGLPVGKHLMVVDAFDGCYNASSCCFIFEVKDKIAPVMKCDDDLHVTLSNANGYTNGYAQVSAEDIDEGSWDNCKLAWIAARRNVPTACAASFIAKGYDTNNNGKLDPLPADGDWSKADGFDRNGDGDLADFGETFILKGGKLMTPLADFVEFFCCDLAERVTVELWGEDIYGNTNYCWMDLLIEDKVAPTCLAPWDVTIYCDDKGIAQIDDKVVSAKIFGDVTIPTGNDCAALDTVYTTEKKLKCGYGYIDRIWTLTKQTAKGPISVTCRQRVNILPVHEYNICFPKDVSSDCKTPIIDTVLTDELGCDILAVNVTDKRYDASDDECYKLFRTYSVINWCTYDDRCGDPLAQTNISVIDRGVFGNYGKAPIYVLVRDNQGGKRDGDEEFYISKDLVARNADDIRFTPKYCRESGEYIHSFIYTQIIKVYDDTRPVVTGDPGKFCIREGADCLANIKMVVTGKDNCSDAVTLETQYLMIAPGQTLDASKMILYSTPRWSTKDLGKGQFEINVANLPQGKHDLIVVVRDECGNLSVPTRIPFTVEDCKGPAPICINGLSTELMPDGNGGGMMAVWASDFVASKVYDCNGQGPETKDGLKLVTKYSLNRVGSPVVATQTGINLTCADKGKVVLVELHAWDEAGKDDFCVTYVEVQDNRAVCPAIGSGNTATVAGTIATEGSANLQGATITLSGSASQSATSTANGGYSFVNLTKGADFTVTPQLDKNHLNGVSTFDLVLIQKHILNVQALNSPYKMIAADVNNSKSITTLDLIALRKLILNIDQTFQNNTSWRFVDASYSFPTPSNPWAAAFPEVVNINDIAANVTANFVAVKVGDVNASATVSAAAAAEVRTAGTLDINAADAALKAGQEYSVEFTATELKSVQGYQFALSLDQSKVELLDIVYGVAKAENFGVFKNEGLITTSWNSKYEPGALFTLLLRAKADAKLSSTLSLNRVVHPEAYNQNNENLGIALNFEGIQATEAYELKQNTPNPFSDETLIGFSLPKAMKGTLIVRDVKGALVYKVEGNYAKGNNQVTLKKEHLGASGVLYYTLETTDFTATKKMVILE